MMKPALPKKTVRTRFGDVAYLETGDSSKPPVLFVHGIPTSSYLWRHVLRFLQDDFHCIAPDLMGLGDTVVDPTKVAMHMDAQAEMLVELMEELGHPHFGLVCHDQGGAAAQIIVANLPQRVDCFVMANCVCYDNWPVPLIARMQQIARVPVLRELLGYPAFVEWFETKTPLSRFRSGLYQGHKLSDASIREYLRPMRQSRAGLERFRAFLLAGHPRYSERAVDGLKRYDKPALVLWAADDRYLSPSWGKKLSEDIPGVERLELIPFCGHFWQEERPAEFASHMLTFLGKHLLGRADEARPSAPDSKRRRLPLSDPGRPPAEIERSSA